MLQLQLHQQLLKSLSRGGGPASGTERQRPMLTHASRTSTLEVAPARGRDGKSPSVDAPPPASGRNRAQLQLGRSRAGKPHRRRRAETTKDTPAIQRSEQQEQQPPEQPRQVQLPWDRHEQCVAAGGAELRDALAPAATAAGPDQDEAAASAVPDQPMTARHPQPVDAARQPSTTAEQPLPRNPKPPAKRSKAKAAAVAAPANEEEWQRALRRQRSSESYWAAQVDLSTGFPVPLGCSPRRRPDGPSSWSFVQRRAEASARAGLQVRAQQNPLAVAPMPYGPLRHGTATSTAQRSRLKLMNAPRHWCRSRVPLSTTRHR